MFFLRKDYLDDIDELEIKEDEDVVDDNVLETKEELDFDDELLVDIAEEEQEDADVDSEVLEELDFDDELLDNITEDEIDSIELLLSKLLKEEVYIKEFVSIWYLRDKLQLLLVSDDEREVESVDVNTLEELEDSSQRHSSVVVMPTAIKNKKFN